MKKSALKRIIDRAASDMAAWRRSGIRWIQPSDLKNRRQ